MGFASINNHFVRKWDYYTLKRAS